MSIIFNGTNATEVIAEQNKDRDRWHIYCRLIKFGIPYDKYVGTIAEKCDPENLAREICKNAKRLSYEIKIGAIIIF